MKIDSSTLAARITQGHGTSPADLVIKNVRLLDLVTGALIPTDIAICGPTIVGTYGEYRGAREIAGRARIAVPGFIDTHVHVESSLVTPLEFDRCVLPHGVTTAIYDPHEMANVLGEVSFDYFLGWIYACSSQAACPPCTSKRRAHGSGPRPSSASRPPTRARSCRVHELSG